MDLFDQNLNKKEHSPLADRMRPDDFDGFVGQEHIIGQGKLLRKVIDQDNLISMIFWGPPGSGKTTLGRIIANLTKSAFVQFSAVTSGVKELRQIIKEAEDRLKYNNKKSILFIDEIHRWNKSQQDALLPYVESGKLILIGATTENPSFEVNSALLSRCRVFVLEPLIQEDILKILDKAVTDKERGLGNYSFEVNREILDYLAGLSNGDARVALNALEFAFKSQSNEINKEVIKQALQKTHLMYDKTGEEHYNIISALHKSMRGSDPDAALYWLSRMLEAGEDPLYIARRLIRFASEDIGLADPNALVQAVSAYTSSHYIGMPECNLNLAQAVVYMAKAPKNNQLYRAYGRVKNDVHKHGNLAVPLHLRNAPTGLMKNLGYGKDYKYNPDYDEEVEQDYLPKELKNKKYL